MKRIMSVGLAERSAQSGHSQQSTRRSVDWLVETAGSVLCGLIEATSEQFGFRGFNTVKICSDPRAIIQTAWDRKTDVFDLEISDTFLRTVDEQQLKSLLVRAMAFAAIGCHDTLAALDEEVAAARTSRFVLIRAIKLWCVLRKQREMRHTLEFLADLKIFEVSLDEGLIRFLESHKEPLIKRCEHRLGWDPWAPSHKERLEVLREASLAPAGT